MGMLANQFSDLFFFCCPGACGFSDGTEYSIVFFNDSANNFLPCLTYLYLKAILV